MTGPDDQERRGEETTWRVSSRGWKGKHVSPEDALGMDNAVKEAAEHGATGIFHQDVTAACASGGWHRDHPMTLWTVAVSANVFPTYAVEPEMRRFEGPTYFANPGVALAHSRLRTFWDDRDLVCLALRRRSALWTDRGWRWRRPGVEPYRGQ